MTINGYCNGYLGDVLAAHENENTDFLMSMTTDIADRMTALKQQLEDQITTVYGEFIRVPREARRMKNALKAITDQVEALDNKIKAKAVPNLKNSISEMTGLSKRITEISLTGKIVDELAQLNNLFVRAQDFQRDKKYFDAVKSFEMLYLDLNKASDEAKRLQVVCALVTETTKSRVYLQDLMTNTLLECFQYQVTTGIDPSKISYYTLKVDKSRKEDFEESFQALHYLKKLDSFFVEFAAWLKNNIMSPIILHWCSVTIENKDGKNMILKVEADFSLPKSTYTKVFANLSFALTFLNNYLGVQVGENSTIMNELGKLISNDFCSTLISHCLADTIPSHSNQLDEYKVVISATEDFHNNMKAIGFLDGSNSNLTDYTTNAEKLCATKTTKLLLTRARGIILKDLYDVMEVEIVPEALARLVKEPLDEEEDSLPEDDRMPEEEPSPKPKESPAKIEVNQGMLADIEKMNQEFIDSVLEEYASQKPKNLKNTPLNKDLDRKQSPTKQKSKTPAPSTVVSEQLHSKQIGSPIKKGTEQIRTPVKDVTEQIGSDAKEDSEQIKSPVMEDSEQIKSPVKEDLEQIRSPVKEDPEQIRSPAKENPEQISSPFKENPEQIKSPVKEDPELIKSPAKEDLEQIKSPGKGDPEQIRSPFNEDPEQIKSSAKEDPELIKSPAKEDPELIKSPGKEDPELIICPAKEDPEQIKCPFKEDPEQIKSPAKEDLEQIKSPGKEDPEQIKSSAKEDPEQIRSINMEDSGQKQNLVKEDSLPMQSPVKEHVKVLNVVSYSPKKEGSLKGDMDRSLQDGTDSEVCNGEMDFLHKGSPAHKDLEQKPDSARKHIGSATGEMAMISNETKPTAMSSEHEDSTKDTEKINDSLQGSVASQHNLSQEECGASKATPDAFKRVRSLSDADEEISTSESYFEELFAKTNQHATTLKLVTTTDETHFDLIGAVYAFPRCQISKSANELIALLNEILNDCIGTSSKCARNLFKTARKIVELYCAITPIYFKEYLETIPQQAAIFHNNCLYIAHCLLTLGHLQRLLLPDGAHTIGSFADQVIVVRTLGASVFLAHMQIQRNQILDIIRNCGLSTLRECSTLNQDTERALRQCVRQLEKLKSVWQPVLPINVYINSMACIMNSFLDELINRVVTVQDIPAETASLLVKMFSVVITRVKAIFPDPNIVEVFNNWEMFQELVLILGANLKFIKDRWANGQGPLALHFTPAQLRQLIRALFQNTERRSAVLAEIH